MSVLPWFSNSLCVRLASLSSGMSLSLRNSAISLSSSCSLQTFVSHRWEWKAGTGWECGEMVNNMGMRREERKWVKERQEWVIVIKLWALWLGHGGPVELSLGRALMSVKILTETEKHFLSDSLINYEALKYKWWAVCLFRAVLQCLCCIRRAVIRNLVLNMHFLCSFLFTSPTPVFVPVLYIFTLIYPF